MPDTFLTMLQQEKNELHTRLVNLDGFLKYPGSVKGMPDQLVDSLFKQQEAMQSYYKQLNLRLYFYEHGEWPS